MFKRSADGLPGGRGSAGLVSAVLLALALALLGGWLLWGRARAPEAVTVGRQVLSDLGDPRLRLADCRRLGYPADRWECNIYAHKPACGYRYGVSVRDHEVVAERLEAPSGRTLLARALHPC